MMQTSKQKKQKEEINVRKGNGLLSRNILIINQKYTRHIKLQLKLYSPKTKYAKFWNRDWICINQLEPPQHGTKCNKN